MAKKMGRPTGSINKEYDVVEAAPTICKKCGSTKRASYNEKVQRQPYQDIQVNSRTGREFNVIEYRPTHCLNCLQCRLDKTEILEPREG